MSRAEVRVHFTPDDLLELARRKVPSLAHVEPAGGDGGLPPVSLYATEAEDSDFDPLIGGVNLVIRLRQTDAV